MSNDMSERMLGMLERMSKRYVDRMSNTCCSTFRVDWFGSHAMSELAEECPVTIFVASSRFANRVGYVALYLCGMVYEAVSTRRTSIRAMCSSLSNFGVLLDFFWCPCRARSKLRRS